MGFTDVGEVVVTGDDRGWEALPPELTKQLIGAEIVADCIGGDRKRGRSRHLWATVAGTGEIFIVECLLVHGPRKGLLRRREEPTLYVRVISRGHDLRRAFAAARKVAGSWLDAGDRIRNGAPVDYQLFVEQFGASEAARKLGIAAAQVRS